MSTNYYVITPGQPADSEGIHLGQSSFGGFTFRAHPDQGVTDYAAWLRQLDQGEIRTEAGAPVSRELMVRIALERKRVPSWTERGAAFRYGFYDADGRRWLTVDFC